LRVAGHPHVPQKGWLKIIIIIIFFFKKKALKLKIK
jgi:hypothetical protein